MDTLTFRQLLQKMSQVAGEKFEETESEIFSRISNNDTKGITAEIHSVFVLIKSLYPMSPILEITRSKFCDLRIQRYKDIDGLWKFSIGLAFLQDYKKSVKNLDKTILEQIVSIVEKKNLQDIINDISVNDKQWVFHEKNKTF